MLSLDTLRFLAEVSCLIGEALLGEGLGDFWEPGWSSVGDTQRERFTSAISAPWAMMIPTSGWVSPLLDERDAL